jgi:hypothetical protein
MKTTIFKVEASTKRATATKRIPASEVRIDTRVSELIVQFPLFVVA